MRRVLEDVDEGLLAAVVYELAQMNVKKAARYRPHPLENKVVLECECEPEKVIEAIRRVKEKLLEAKKQLCF